MNRYKKVAASMVAAIFLLSPILIQAGVWEDYVGKSPNNVLPDFSYAGYHHGEEAPADVYSLGYTIINVKDYMAANGLTARQALMNIAAKYKNREKAKVIIYFPEGDYVLHTKDDNINGKSFCINILAGHIVLKGDGVGKTRLIMQDPNLPNNPNTLYSSPAMIQLRNNGEVAPKYSTKVMADADKGGMSVEVENASMYKAGDWVCLKVVNADRNFIAEELGRPADKAMTNLVKVGVQVYDAHQIKSVSGNTVTFYEPLLHRVESKYNWTLDWFKHFEEVGVEDLTFVGNSVPDFKHHRTWQDDGAYKPIQYVRMVNSWMRRVSFESVSEACTFDGCASVSATEIEIIGNRGHSAIRLQKTTRGFIGNVYDHTRGPLTDDRSQILEDMGQFHACGVSKQSLGCVVYKVKWGRDACFESHATQPRATLIDACYGGFMMYRMGGDQSQLPNHLNDLVIWNFDCKGTSLQTKKAGRFIWWTDPGKSGWMCFMPPVMVGFHGNVADLHFNSDEIKRNEGYGLAEAAHPSLYRAQIQERLHKIPDWLDELDRVDLTTGIGRGTVRTPQPADGRIYNLEGQCVGTDLDTLPHGIYIVCGKKVMR